MTTIPAPARPMSLGHTDRTILAEDDEIRVVYRPGGSDFLLVTFGDLVSLADGARFFADGPVVRANVSCLGFMAKRPNWFPRDSMAGLIGAVRPFLAGYACIVGYGASMGGYAAVKYSRLLGTHQTVALCPQWSLDKEECDGIDPGWQDLYEEGWQRMGVRSADAAGEIFLFYDCYDARDAFHARKLTEVGRVQLVPVPRVGHHVTSTLSGTGTLMRLVDLCRQGDLASLRRLVRASRRASRARTRTVLSFAERRSRR